MFDTILAYLSNAFIAGSIGAALGVAFGPKIKDVVMGIPADTRAVLTAVENDVKAKLAAAKLDVLAQVAPAAVKPPVAPVVVPPAAPVVLVPAPAVPPVTHV